MRTERTGSWRNRSPSAAKSPASPVVRKVVCALAGRIVADPLAGERLGDLAGGLVGGEDERRRAAEDALEERAQQRVVRAAEDDRVDAGLLERRGVVAHGGEELLGPGVPLDQRDEARTGDLGHGHARVERVDDVGVAAARDGSLGGEDADAAVARRLHGGMGLGREDADDRHGELLLEERKRDGGGGVAGGGDELHALALEVGAELERERLHLVRGARAVGAARAVAEVDEVLGRQRDEALVENGEPARAGVEDADRAGIHGGDSTSGPGPQRSND